MSGAHPSAFLRSRMTGQPARVVVRSIAPEREIAGARIELSLAERWAVLTCPLPLKGAAALMETADGGLVVARQLASRMPWLGSYAERIEREAQLQLALGRPWLALPPALMVGPPGCGHAALDLGGASDNRALEGTARGYDQSQPCWPLVVIAQTTCANPMLVLDEVDKAGGGSANGRPLHTLLAMLEPATARRYHDTCLVADADISGCNWLLTANTTGGLPRPLLSRLDVVEVTPPSASEVGALIDVLIGDLAREWQVDAAMLPALPKSTRRLLVDGYERSGSVRALKRQVRACLAMLLRDAPLRSRAC